MTQRNNLPAATKPFNPTDHMMKLSGKEYLPVAARIAWLSAEFGHEVSIRTAMVESNQWTDEDPKKSRPGAPVPRVVREAVFKATVTFPNGTEVSAYGSETSADFGDYREKAETKALGRALGYAGYGTLQAPEFDEAATIARAEARNRTQENTYENTRAVDTAQDLTGLEARRAESAPAPAPQEVTPSTQKTPEVTAPSTSPSTSPASPSTPLSAPAAPAAPALDDMDNGQLRKVLIEQLALSKGTPVEEQAAGMLTAANAAGKVKKAGDLELGALRTLVRSVMELVSTSRAA